MSEDTQTVGNMQFLATIFNDVTEDEVAAVCSFPGAPDQREAEGRGWPVYHPFDNRIRRLIDGVRCHETNSYYCIAAVANANHLHRSRDALKGVFCFPLDDIGVGEGAKYTPDTVPLEPSYIIETSKDNYQYGYLPNEPVRDISKAQALLKCMAEEHGDSGAPIAGKLVRLPVGWNSKTKYGSPPPQVRLASWHPERRYTVEQLMNAFGVTEQQLETERQRAARRAPRRTGVELNEDVILTWLTEQGRVHDALVNDRGFVTIECPWGTEHTDDNTVAQYSPYGEGGEYRFDRQFICFHEHCRERSIVELLGWVRKEGGPDADNMLQHFIERYVFVEPQEIVCDRERPQIPYRWQAFKTARSNKFYWKDKKRIPYATEWILHPNRVSVDTMDFHPQKPQVFEGRGGTSFNIYRPFGHGDPTGDASAVMPILKHLKYLFGDDMNHALGWLACTVHAPHIRIQHALLHIARHHGTGRGWLIKLMRKLMVYPKYVTSPDLKDFVTGEFNEWLMGSLLAAFDEVYQPGNRFRVQDTLRKMITEPRLYINVKHGFKGEMDIFANIIFLSNHYNALEIADEDRRLWVVLCEHEPLTAAQYTALFDLLENEEAVRQMFWFLKRHLDTQSFNPHGRAPNTKARQRLMDANADDFTRAIQEVVNDLREGGAKAIYRGHLIALCRDAGVPLPTDMDRAATGKWNAVLSDLHALPGGNRLRISARAQQMLRNETPRQLPRVLVPFAELGEGKDTIKLECERVLFNERWAIKQSGFGSR